MSLETEQIPQLESQKETINIENPQSTMLDVEIVLSHYFKSTSRTLVLADIKGQIADDTFVQIEHNHTKKTLTLIDEWGNKKLFDLNKYIEKIERESIQREQQQQKLGREIAPENTRLGGYIEALDALFDKNLESNRELNRFDILESSVAWMQELQWLNIQEISNLVRKSIERNDARMLEADYTSQGVRDIFLDLKKKYLYMTMWVWKKYEMAASAFLKTGAEVDKILWQVLTAESITQNLDDLRDIHQKIAENYGQSITVKKWYKLLLSSLQKMILSKITKPDNYSTEEQRQYILEFVSIVRGKKIVSQTKWKGKMSRHMRNNYNPIHDDYKDSDIANQALMYLVTEPKGILEKLQASPLFKMEDEKVWDRFANDIAKKTLDRIDSFEKQYGVALLWDTDDQGWKEVFLNLPNKPYNQLNFQEKILVSYLVRLDTYIESKWTKYAQFHIWQARTNPNYTTEGLQDFLIKGFIGVYNDTQKFVSDSFEDNFDAQFSDTSTWLSGTEGAYFWLNESDSEIITLLNDINWAGLDISDSVWSMSKIWGKILAVMALSIALGWPLALMMWGWFIAQWTVIWIVSGPIGNMIMWKDYDTNKELITDITTDAMVNGSIGAWAWWIARWFASQNLNVFSNAWANKNNLIFWWDLSAGIWFEMWRTSEMDKQFHWEDSFFDHAWKDFYDRWKTYEDPIIYGP